MSTINLQCTKMAKADYLNPAVNYPHTAIPALDAVHVQTYFCGFAALPATLQYKCITGMSLFCRILPYSSAIGGITRDYKAQGQARYIARAWTETEVSWNSMPPTGSLTAKTGYHSGNYAQWAEAALSSFSWYKNALAFGIAFQGWTDDVDSFNAQLYTINSADVPYLSVTYEADEIYLKPSYCSPTSGYMPEQETSTFRWGSGYSGDCAGTLTVANSKFRWRPNSSSAYTEIDCGTALSYTMPANTVTTDSLQWQVVITDSNGTSTASAWYTLSTVEATSTATADSPVNAIVDGDSAVIFRWTHNIDTGTAQSSAELQKSQDGSTWAALATVTGTETSYTLPADSLSSGTWCWRVRTYNTDDLPGSWSDAAQFIAVGSPSTPAIAILSTAPRPSIRWQTDEQQACQIRIDGGDAETRYGSDRQWLCPRYLSDGEHVISVRVQNAYGLWSDWGSVVIPVANTAGTEITLSIDADYRAYLSWTGSGYDYYLVYRDEIPIAKTTESGYTDNFSSGTVQYFVRGCYADSYNYGSSQRISAEIETDSVYIAAVKDPVWIKINTFIGNPSAGHSIARLNSTVHLSGRELPVVVSSEFFDIELAVAGLVVTDKTQQRQLESLVGQLVCLKIPGGNMATGMFALQSKAIYAKYCQYGISVVDTDYMEGIDIDA